jgi:hypothetical protein
MDAFISADLFCSLKSLCSNYSGVIIMSAEFIFRLFGMVIMAIVGGIWGQRIGTPLIWKLYRAVCPLNSIVSFLVCLVS